MAASVVVDNAVCEAYEEVRCDTNKETSWVVLRYNCDNCKLIEVEAKGTDYDELISKFHEDERKYAYVRYETGDEMSRRAKFAMITWIGPSVSPLKKGKVSTDKAFVKEIFKNFGKEILSDDKSELRQDKIANMLQAASGAKYGTG